VSLTATARLAAAAGAAMAAVLLAVHPAHAAVHHAALVIQHSSGSLITRCVAFAEAQITGLQLVQRSGVSYTAQDFGSIGSAMCQLDREPSTVPAGCFGSGRYWQYFHRQGGAWQASMVGASSSTLHDGDMDGWRYAAGAAQSPAIIAFQAVCGPSTPPVNTTHPAATSPVRTPPAQITSAAAAAATPSPTTSLEATAASASPTRGAILASTGPPTQPPVTVSLVPWLALGGTAVLLLGLGAINLRRRGP
jgi:cell division septation protein DedD